jgi:hypothetical protein
VRAVARLQLAIVARPAVAVARRLTVHVARLGGAAIAGRLAAVGALSLRLRGTLARSIA